MGDEVTTLRRVRGFRSYWSAATISSFGSAVSAVAVPVLVVTVLDTSPLEVGLVNAAQFLPYALFGLIVGAYVDRFRRKPLVIWASIGRGVCLGAVPVLWWTGLLNLWVTAAALFVFGILSVVGFAATQSLLPRIVPLSSWRRTRGWIRATRLHRRWARLSEVSWSASRPLLSRSPSTR